MNYLVNLIIGDDCNNQDLLSFFAYYLPPKDNEEYYGNGFNLSLQGVYANGGKFEKYIDLRYTKGYDFNNNSDRIKFILNIICDCWTGKHGAYTVNQISIIKN